MYLGHAQDDYDFEDAFADDISHEDPESSESPLLNDELCNQNERIQIISPRGVCFELPWN
jgi:hypothetical protein